MAHTVKAYYKGLHAIFNKEIDVDTDTLDVILVSNGYTPDYVNDEFVDDGGADDVIDAEINAGNGNTNGYYAGYGNTGRQQPGSATLTVDANGITVDIADVTFTSLGAALADVTYIVIAKQGSADDTTAQLLFCIELDPVYDPQGGDLQVQFNASGLYRIANP
jgi:hypothetical protein